MAIDLNRARKMQMLGVNARRFCGRAEPRDRLSDGCERKIQFEKPPCRFYGWQRRNSLDVVLAEANLAQPQNEGVDGDVPKGGPGHYVHGETGNSQNEEPLLNYIHDRVR